MCVCVLCSSEPSKQLPPAHATHFLPPPILFAVLVFLPSSSCCHAPVVLCNRYAEVLGNICKERGIDVQLNSVLTEIRADAKEAVFKQGDQTKVVPYDYIHVTPYMGSPDFIKQVPFQKRKASGTEKKKSAAMCVCV